MGQYQCCPAPLESPNREFIGCVLTTTGTCYISSSFSNGIFAFGGALPAEFARTSCRRTSQDGGSYYTIGDPPSSCSYAEFDAGASVTLTDVVVDANGEHILGNIMSRDGQLRWFGVSMNNLLRERLFVEQSPVTAMLQQQQQQGQASDPLFKMFLDVNSKLARRTD